jgi:transcription elongation factor GreB
VSRAFVKEDNVEVPLVVPRAPLPEGAPNYVTRRGLAALREERAALEASRPTASGTAGAAELAAYHARLSALDARIQSAVTPDPSALAHDEVRFSATVTRRTDSGDERRYQVVGVDEADPKAGKIAFTAPLARELMGKRVGDSVSLRQPSDAEYEVVAIDYPPL